jgi:hypothetical protein
MDRVFLEYYEEELTHIRDLAAEFADMHPAVARNLALDTVPFAHYVGDGGPGAPRRLAHGAPPVKPRPRPPPPPSHLPRPPAAGPPRGGGPAAPPRPPRGRRAGPW